MNLNGLILFLSLGRKCDKYCPSVKVQVALSSELEFEHQVTMPGGGGGEGGA